MNLMNKFSNYRYWSDENPHWTLDINTVKSDKVMVWAGIINQDVIGPYFFERNVNTDTYLELMGDYVYPELILRGYNPENVWYHHDGAPAHRALDTRDWLDANFNNWIGIGGTIHWPARSPDLNPLDFFLWGRTKSDIYRIKSRNINELKLKIQQSFQTVTPAMLTNVKNHMEQRIVMCRAADGMLFEQYL